MIRINKMDHVDVPSGYFLKDIQVEDPFDSLRNTVAFDARDWSLTNRDAWLYGIICGWDTGSLKELAIVYKWNEKEIQRLKRLRTQFVLAKELYAKADKTSRS